jgi:hypothetical protein
MIAAFSGKLTAVFSGDLVDSRSLSRGQGGENRRLGGCRTRLGIAIGFHVRSPGLAGLRRVRWG